MFVHHKTTQFREEARELIEKRENKLAEKFFKRLSNISSLIILGLFTL